ncbi:MAG: alpha/beta hydrolase [Bacteroidetes bacterium]|nr:alpha/beta hydrolase [Bacteroidota bacterium]
MKVQLQHQGRKINYQVNGTGEAIVLLHGFLESQDIWEKFSQKLSSDFKVITTDLPGHGQTEVFGDIHSMEFMADMVRLILQTQNIDKAIFIGHSMGGYVALAFAEKYPEMTGGLVIFHSHAGADTEEAKMNRSRTIQIIEQNRIGFINTFIPDLFAPANVSKLKNEIEHLKELAEKTPKEGIIAALNGMKERTDKTEMLSQLDAPVLFIIGKQDKRINLMHVLEQAANPKHSEVLILNDAGHMGYIEAPRMTFETIRNFCKKIT